MRFSPVKRFLGGNGDDAIRWLKNQLSPTLRDLYIGLSNLSFGDNFKSFEWEGSIAPGVEQLIQHDLNVTPTRFQVLAPIGNVLIIKGDTEPSPTKFYVKSVATLSTFSGRIILFP